MSGHDAPSGRVKTLARREGRKAGPHLLRDMWMWLWVCLCLSFGHPCNVCWLNLADALLACMVLQTLLSQHLPQAAWPWHQKLRACTQPCCCCCCCTSIPRRTTEQSPAAAAPTLQGKPCLRPSWGGHAALKIRRGCWW
jgi:hypothetical protein